MKKNILITVLLTCMCFFTSCTSTQQTPTAAPIPTYTATPTVEPTIEFTTSINETVTEKTNTADTAYIGNKNSKKFHRPNCRTLPAEKNRVPLASYEDAINSGYTPCGNCIGK